MEVFCFVITIRNSDMDMFFHCICNYKVRLLSNPKPCGGKFIEIAWKFMPCDCCGVFFPFNVEQFNNKYSCISVNYFDNLFNNSDVRS